NLTQNGGHPFTSQHANGDILVVSDFTIGGSTSTIKVFKWVGNDATGSLVALNNGNPINGDTFAIVNGAPISVPWSYTNKSGAHAPAAGEFLEEGVDLTALGLDGCFSAFLAETRSSQSPTATLSDFVAGNFPLCSISATPFTGLSKVGDSIVYPLTVTNASATNTVNLFQPSATLAVTANPTTALHLGDLITYTYTVNNTSSADSPNLVLGTANDSFIDSLLGDVEADAVAAGGGSTAP